MVMFCMTAATMESMVKEPNAIGADGEGATFSR